MEQFEIHFENVIKSFFQTRSDTVTYSMENQKIPESRIDMKTVPFEAIQNSL